MADVNGIPEATEDKPTPSDNPIDRMIDIAIEAQDGPADKTSDTETQTGEQTAKRSEANASNEQKDSNSGTGDTKPQPNATETSKEPRVGSPQDLIVKGQGPDGADLVVKGGPERRFYEQREVARQQTIAAQRDAQAASTRAEKAEGELNTLRTTVQNLNGVDPEALRIGAAIVTDLQRDPVATMKKLLAEVIAQGHTIEGIGAGVDQLAMQRMIDARLSTQETPQQTEAQVLAEATQEVNNFYGSHPDARPHDALIGRMLRDHPSLTLETAYFELKNAFIEKNFDWSRSIDENLGNASHNTAPQPQPNQQPMPNGRNVSNGSVSPAGEVKIAHEDTSMDDIVKQAMRESGLNI